MKLVQEDCPFCGETWSLTVYDDGNEKRSGFSEDGRDEETLKPRIKCENCSYSCVTPFSKTESKCPICDGTGTEVILGGGLNSRGEPVDTKEVCSRCGGSGSI